MRPLTLENPKPLLSVGGFPLLHRLVNQFPEKIEEIIIVIGYLGEKIQKYCGEEFLGRRVSYVWQKEKRGTYDALERARHLLNDEPFALFFADDILDRETIRELLQHPLAAVITEVPDPRPFGVIILNLDDTIAEIDEKPAAPKSHSVLTTAYALTPHIFNYAPSPRPNGEVYLADALNEMAKEHTIRAIRAKTWFPIGTPADIERAEVALKELGD